MSRQEKLKEYFYHADKSTRKPILYSALIVGLSTQIMSFLYNTKVYGIDDDLVDVWSITHTAILYMLVVITWYFTDNLKLNAIFWFIITFLFEFIEYTFQWGYEQGLSFGGTFEAYNYSAEIVGNRLTDLLFNLLGIILAYLVINTHIKNELRLKNIY